MKFKEGMRVEVTGDPEDPGFEGSWWTAVVMRQQRRGRRVQVTIRYDELLEEDGVTKTEETVPLARVRPACPDDSGSVPLADRFPGEPVDCWHQDGWWEGYVHRVFDDHITVYFPASDEEYSDIYVPAVPEEFHRVRTGRNWDAAQGAWVGRPRKAFAGAGDFRTAAAKPGAAGPGAAPPKAAAAAAAAERGATTTASSSSSEEDKPIRRVEAPRAAAAKVVQSAAGAAAKVAQPAAPQPAGPAVSESSSSEDEGPLSQRAVHVKARAAKPPPVQAAPAAKAAAAAPQPAAAAPKQPPQPAASSSSEDEGPLSQRSVPAKPGASKPPAVQQAAVAAKPVAAAPKAAAAAPQQPASSSSEEDVPLVARRAAAKAPALEPRQPPAADGRQRQQPQQQQQQQQQREEPSPTGQAAVTALAGKASESPEGGLAAANARVADLLTSLDAGDDEEAAPGGLHKAVAQPAEPAAAAAAPAATAAAQQHPVAASAPAAAKQAPPAAAPVAAAAPAAAKQVPAGAAPAAAAAPPAAAAVAVAKPALAARRQQSAPKEPVRQEPVAPRQGPLQLPTSLDELKAAPPKRRQQQDEAALQRQASDVQLPTTLADLKAPPPKRQRQEQQREGLLQKQLSDLQRKKHAQAQALQAALQPRPEQRQQDVRQPPAQQQLQQAGAAAAKGKAAAAAKPLQRTASKAMNLPGSFKGGSGKAAAASGGAKLAPLIPKRAVGGEGGALESPRAPAAPSHQQQQQLAAAAANGEAAAQQRAHKRRRDEAGGGGDRGREQPLSPRTTAAAAAPQQQQPRRRADPDVDWPTVWCLDNLPAPIDTTALQEALAGVGIAGLKSVEVAAVPLDRGDRHGGYAVLRFASGAAAQRSYDQLRTLCLLTPTCPIPRPLILRQPRIEEGYAWGPEARLPGHFPLDYAANQHFAQPNSIEFDLAIEWRQVLGQLAGTKQELCMEQATELAEQMAYYLHAVGQPPPPIVPARLQLPGDGPGPGGAGASGAGEGGGSACVWLSGVLASATEEQLMEAFAQFSFPQKVHLVQDPVTRKPSSHAVLWVESHQRARDLVQNLREMVYLLNGTPRAVDASLAVPGPARGSQSTYDRALRCMFGTDDSELAGNVQFVFVRDEELLELPPSADQLAKLPAGERQEAASRRAAIALRRLLRSHRKEQARGRGSLAGAAGWRDELAREKRERLQALDTQQRQHFQHEKLKLGRLAAIQHKQIAPAVYLLDHLLERHGLQGQGLRVYRNKESSRLVRYVEQAAQQAQQAQQRAARAKR